MNKNVSGHYAICLGKWGWTIINLSLWFLLSWQNLKLAGQNNYMLTLIEFDVKNKELSTKISIWVLLIQVICSKLAKMQKDLTVSYLSSYKQDFVNKSNERTVEKIFRRGGGQNSQNSNSAELFGKPIIRVLENVYLHVDSCVFVFTRRVMPKYGRYPEDTVLRRRNRTTTTSSLRGASSFYFHSDTSFHDAPLKRNSEPNPLHKSVWY